MIHNDGAGVEAAIERAATETRVRAKLLVAADGRASGIRKMAGIEEEKERLSTMAGYLIDSDDLPHPGYGHLFVGGPAPILAYQIAPHEARVMLDIPDGEHGIDAPKKDPSYLAHLPPLFRAACERALHGQRASVSANFTRTPRSLSRGRVVLAGDAAGCCHPLGASGLSSCTRDALGLKRALLPNPHDMGAALVRYADLRRGPQRTRISLAGALYQAFSNPGPEMALLRRGLFRYWAKSDRGRAASMGLLTTHETRMFVMAREYARVVGYALPELARLPLSPRQDSDGASRGANAIAARIGRSLQDRRRAMAGLVRSTLPYVRGTVRDALDSSRSIFRRRG